MDSTFDDCEPLTTAQHLMIAEHALSARGAVIDNLLPRIGETQMPANSVTDAVEFTNELLAVLVSK